MIRYFKQEKDWWCGPAVMQMALASFKIKKSQASLAKEMRTRNDDIGTKNSSMIKIAKKYINFVNHEEKRSFTKIKKYLDQDAIVIVTYFYESDKTGHFAIVKKIINNKIYLIDPQDGPNKSFTLNQFNKIWYDNESKTGWHLILIN